MKNILFNSAIVFLLLISNTLLAQDFQGKAVYQSKTTLDIDFSTSGIPADRIQMIKERMKNNLDRTYELTFNKTASNYKQEEKLDQSPNSGGGGMRMMFMGGGATGKHYKNIQTKTSAKENEFSGKPFLVKDSLISYVWKMEQETKMIGQNLCFKATTVIERPIRREFQFGRGRESQSEEDKKAAEKKEEEQKNMKEIIIVTAWYTLDIPVSNGPGDYWGLPGLILEISDDSTTILCTKIVINPKEKDDISEPKKGKVVSQKEYDEIVAEKTKEMRERMQNERQKSGGGGHIRIGN